MLSFLVAFVLLAPVQQPETLSLLEEPLYAPPVPKAERARLESELAAARAEVSRDPSSVDAALRLASTLRDLGRIGDALESLTRAMEGKPDVSRLRLARGRGFITIRKFDLAQRELKKAVDTLPEAHCDIGFALYLLGEFHFAKDAYAKCADPGIFGYLSVRRSGAAAGPRPDLPPDSDRRGSSITLPGSVASKPKSDAPPIAAAYLDAVDRLLAKDTAAAKELLKPIVEKKTRWMEPVYIAAEADYARILSAEPKKKKRKKD